MSKIQMFAGTRGMASKAAGAEATLRFIELQGQLLSLYGASASSRFLQLEKPKMRAHVLEAGAGEPVIIIHGGDGEAVNWAPLIGMLQHEARVFAVDRPGFGLSDAFDYGRVDLRKHAADFVASLLDALGLEKATIIGGSMGGYFSMVAALDRPDRVSRLILVGYPLGMAASLPLPLRIICGVPGMSRLFMRGRDSLDAQRKQYRQMFNVDPDTVPELFFQARIAGIRLPSERGTWATLLRRVATVRGLKPGIHLGPELPKISAPTLVIWGEHDMATEAEGFEAAARLPNGRFECLKGIGHFPFLEAPGRTHDLIVEFMKQTPAVDGAEAHPGVEHTNAPQASQPSRNLDWHAETRPG